MARTYSNILLFLSITYCIQAHIEGSQTTQQKEFAMKACATDEEEYMLSRRACKMKSYMISEAPEETSTDIYIRFNELRLFFKQLVLAIEKITVFEE